MSVSNPLLKELKGYILNLTLGHGLSPTGNDITDSSHILQQLCMCIERILHTGLVPQKSTFGFCREDAWFWMDVIAEKHRNVPYAFKSSWTSVKNCKKVKSHIGRLRLLIRTCLTMRCLHVPIEIFVTNKYYSHFYQSNSSILGDEILGQILLSAVQQCSRLPFKLNVKNASFLDETWVLPVTAQYEFVPCRSLGFCVAFIKNVSIIVEIKPKSIANENENIEIGDILDEINGTFINSESQGQLSSIMKKSSKTLTPLLLTIVKAFCPHSGKLFTPMNPILRQARLDIAKLELSHRERFQMMNSEELENVENQSKDEKLVQPIRTPLNNPANKSAESPSDIKPGFRVTYVGKISAGVTGHVKQLEETMSSLFTHLGKHIDQAVYIECQELDVKVSSQVTPQVLLRHSYMEISACGRSLKYPRHFAYIAGDDGVSCVSAKSFSMYMFRSQDSKEIDQILMSIGQGFKRTHFAV